jgi:AraC-like DNA-binding protein
VGSALDHVEPPKSLVGEIDEVRVVYDVPPGRRYHQLADGRAELVVHVGRAATSATVIGTRSHSLTKHATGGRSVVIIQFALAGAYALLGGPIAPLTDRVLSLRELWPREFVAALDDAQAPDEVLRALFGALAARRGQRADHEIAEAHRVRALVSRLRTASPLPNVRTIAAEVGASERQLRRTVSAVLGFSPKRLLRILRFQRAVELCRSGGRTDWATIAQAAGYFDQSHLTADFRTLAGTTPSRYLANGS